MTALMTLLCGTLPIAAADCELRGGKPVVGARGVAFQENDLSELIKVITYLPPPNSTVPPDPSGPFAFTGWNAEKGTSREWSIDPASLDDPSSVKKVRYRQNVEHAIEYPVFDKVSFGHLEKDVFDSTVTVHLCDQTVKLPLTNQFLWAQWMVHGARLAKGDHPMWLETSIDLSLLRVFVFDLVPTSDAGGTKLVPRSVDTASDANLNKVREIYRELYDHNNVGDPKKGDDSEHDLNLNLDLDFFPIEAHKAACDVNDSTDVHVHPTRIVVACSLTLCERSKDFEPSGTSEVARVYPHIAVIANVVIDRIQAAIKIERPATSAAFSNRGMDGMLAAFTNDGAFTFEPFPPPVPFWDNTLNYYQAGLSPMVGRTLSVVDSALTGKRSDNSGLVKRKGEHYGHYSEDFVQQRMNKSNEGKELLVMKTSRQAAFDSLQIGPTMCPFSASMVSWSFVSTSAVAFSAKVTSLASWFLDAIQSSPGGGADSTFWVWRWTDSSFRPSTWGFSAQGPYGVPGAPMVPENQNVFIRVMSKSSFVYAAKAAGSHALAWSYFMHHGGAYLVDDQGLRAFVGSTALEYADGCVSIATPNGIVSDVGSSWSFASWRLRYQLGPHNLLSDDPKLEDTKLAIVERVEHVDLEKAMKL